MCVRGALARAEVYLCRKRGRRALILVMRDWGDGDGGFCGLGLGGGGGGGSVAYLLGAGVLRGRCGCCLVGNRWGRRRVRRNMVCVQKVDSGLLDHALN
jgi:hypothetical protein